MEKKDGESSFMIALYPSQETLENILEYRDDISKIHDLSSMREIEPEEIHATIRWWYQSEGGDYHKIAVELETLEMSPVRARIVDVDILGDSLSIMLDSIEMQTLYNRVDNLIKGHGGPESQYPEYKPHISLYYGDWDKVVSDQITEMPDFPIVFDRIAMVDNNDMTYAHVDLESLDNG